MFNSNGYNPNSLFALEQKLLGNNPISPAQQFSDEEFEESEDDRNRGVEARAFDWDEAIELDYPENNYPVTIPMSWEDTDDTSEAFDLEEEDTPTYDVQALEVEDEEILPEDKDLHSHSNSLFALEQSLYRTIPSKQSAQQLSEEEQEDEDTLSHSSSLFALEQNLCRTNPATQQVEQFSLEESESEGVESQAFDWDEAIDLQYSENTYPTAASFNSLTTDDNNQNFGLHNEALTYQVKAFEAEDEAVSELTDENEQGSKAFEVNSYHSAPKTFDNSRAFGENTYNSKREPTDEEHDDSTAFEFNHYNSVPKPNHQVYNAPKTVTVDATVVPSNPPAQPAEPAIDFDEFDREPASSRASDANAFAADLEAILRGEKVYEPPAETSTPTTAPQPQFPPAPQSQAQSVAPKKPSAHDIFDQMGRNMAHASAFDLGTFSLEQTFDEFDELLDREERNQYQTIEAQFSSSPNDEMQADEEMGEAMGFDEMALSEDLDWLNQPEVALQLGVVSSPSNKSNWNQFVHKVAQGNFTNNFKTANKNSIFKTNLNQKTL